MLDSTGTSAGFRSQCEIFDLRMRRLRPAAGRSGSSRRAGSGVPNACSSPRLVPGTCSECSPVLGEIAANSVQSNKVVERQERIC